MISKPMYFDRQGNPMEMMEYARKCYDHDYKILKQEYVGKYFVSTVWIGLNMMIFRNSPIMIFETMIFLTEGLSCSCSDDDLIGYQERYSTEEEAYEGHEIAVKLCRDKLLTEANILVEEND
jgi:hypothetical protein